MGRACVSCIVLLAACGGGEPRATQEHKSDASAAQVDAATVDVQPSAAPAVVDEPGMPEEPAASTTTLALAVRDVTRLAESNYKVDPASGERTENEDRVFERAASTWTSPDGPSGQGASLSVSGTNGTASPPIGRSRRHVRHRR
ncbi:MAG: hypothetical protein AAF721_07605 [Myxococcota bacterium]